MEVKLLGFWPSSFVYRVIWALKLKGVKFDYIEEDLSNPSEFLLQHNPIHKNVPVLVHDSKSISESLVILEYIEETWPQIPLLPNDPRQKALARFWMQFGVNKVRPAVLAYFRAVGDEVQKSREFQEVLKILEELGLGDQKFFGGDYTIGLVDIAFGMLAYWLECIEEVIGVKILEANSLPRLHAWAQNFKELPVIRDNLPDRGKLLAHYKNSREKLIAAASSSQ